uniref:Dual specificity protein kinase TTK n=1 Tax=Sphenodon punctatus TaxID=8508 RepID=A0A8D0L437_SPHPU
MEEEDLSERWQSIASIMNRVRDLKNKHKNEDNVTDELNFTKVSADTTDNSGTVNQIMMTANNPENWLSFLLKLEKKGVPQSDISLLNRLIGRYSQAVAALPAEKHSQDESYARILVRFAELKAIQDPEEARDQYHLARLNCKRFAFVHIAFAQFELSQGNVKKCNQLLQKAVECCAAPQEMLEVALQNLHLQKSQLLPDEEKENLPGGFVTGHHSSISREKKDSPQESNSVLGGRNPLKQLNKSNQACTFGRVPIKLVNYDVDTTKKMDVPLQPSFEQPVLSVSKRSLPPEAALRRSGPASVCGTPGGNTMNDYMACFRTPVVKNNFLPGGQGSTPYFQPLTPISASVPSNECIVVKGKLYSVLKQIGSGGSSKVFQVLTKEKQLYAVKYVNLEEADQQTVESYKNEIAHLNKLQQHSDKIIRLYDYEITEQHIYMIMECGNIDLNSWLKKKKTINPWERKSYWKNMLEAVHTIHQHGIVHSDLKPANFLIVDGMLKLIDFGIANQMQPDVTSIVKDSQVGTVNFMPPEAIKDMSSYGENGKTRSKISPQSDVWSLGCILYCMTYGRTPFQHITNQISKLLAIIDPNYEIEFPGIAERDLLDVLKRCLIRNPKQRISISELLTHPYVHIQAHLQTDTNGTTEEMKRILGQLIGLNSPNSISRAARVITCSHYWVHWSNSSSSYRGLEMPYGM